MSQWRRAREFFENLAKSAGLCLSEIYEAPPRNLTFPLPEEELPAAMSRDYGDYSRRRKELLARGRAWFTRVSRAWAEREWVREFEGRDGTRVVWADARVFDVCGIRFVFTEPWFHGAEYDRTGWVVGFLAEVGGCRIVFSSDVTGPIIEDYAKRIAGWEPDIVVLDGPPTYLYPYLLSGVNLRRAIENAKAVIESGPAVVVYDHHLLRERRWRERVREVFEHARTRRVLLLTAAEALGRRPVIDELT